MTWVPISLILNLLGFIILPASVYESVTGSLIHFLKGLTRISPNPQERRKEEMKEVRGPYLSSPYPGGQAPRDTPWKQLSSNVCQVSSIFCSSSKPPNILPISGGPSSACGLPSLMGIVFPPVCSTFLAMASGTIETNTSNRRASLSKVTISSLRVSESTSDLRFILRLWLGSSGLRQILFRICGTLANAIPYDIRFQQISGSIPSHLVNPIRFQYCTWEQKLADQSIWSEYSQNSGNRKCHAGIWLLHPGLIVYYDEHSRYEGSEWRPETIQYQWHSQDRQR